MIKYENQITPFNRVDFLNGDDTEQMGMSGEQIVVAWRPKRVYS